MKSTFIFILILIKFYFGYSQEFNGKLLDNSTFKYTWRKTNLKVTDSGIQISKYLIITDYNRKQLNHLSKVNIEDWILMLNDSTSDWATNLFLYSVFERDATQLVDIPEPLLFWRNCCKTEDIYFWKDYLFSLPTNVIRNKIRNSSVE